MPVPNPRTLVMIQRQMLLIEHCRENELASDESPVPIEIVKQHYFPWPILSGMSPADSAKLRALMEELNLIYGFPQGGLYHFKTTERYEQWLGAAKSGTFVSSHPDPNAFDPIDDELTAAEYTDGGIFVVHGDDLDDEDSLCSKVCRFIRNRLGQDPILLHVGRANGYLMEAFENAASGASVAVCLWTPDRENKSYGAIRPNAMFETGYFVAQLGLQRVIIIRHTGVKKPPTDLDGRSYLTEKDWDQHLALRLIEAMTTDRV